MRKKVISILTDESVPHLLDGQQRTPDDRGVGQDAAKTRSGPKCGPGPQFHWGRPAGRWQRKGRKVERGTVSRRKPEDGSF
jgi:hypothetical protein